MYEDITNPTSFSSARAIAKSNKNLKKSEAEIRRLLQTVDTYTKFRGKKEKFPRRVSSASRINERLQADLIVLPKLGRYNSNYKYLLTVIDCLSRYAYVFPLRTKTGLDVAEQFKRLLQVIKFKYLQTDWATEFYNKHVADLFKKYNVKLYSIYSDKKCSLVERFNRTLMTKISKYLSHNKTKRYIDVLPQIVSNYNNSIHSATLTAPANVTESNQMEAWFNSVGKKYSTLKQKIKFKVGDCVRIKVYKQLFDKGYNQNFSEKIYKISDVHLSTPVTYSVSDNGENVLGIFYAEELSKVNISC